MVFLDYSAAGCVIDNSTETVRKMASPCARFVAGRDRQFAELQVQPIVASVTATSPLKGRFAPVT